METALCLKCVHLTQEETEPYYSKDGYGTREYHARSINWFCHKRPIYVRTVPKACFEFLANTQTRFVKDGEGMVKIDDIPSEGAKMDLANLPPELVLLAIGEKMQEEQAGKTGGLVITYKLEDGRTFNQKYSKVSGAELAAACKRLKVKDTTDLQKAWYKYKLTNMRIGFPRMLPVEKVKEA